MRDIAEVFTDDILMSHLAVDFGMTIHTIAYPTAYDKTT